VGKRERAGESYCACACEILLKAKPEGACARIREAGREEIEAVAIDWW
jgi:hypothetical protein